MSVAMSAPGAIYWRCRWLIQMQNSMIQKDKKFSMGIIQLNQAFTSGT
jgi:hypothetical protein